MFTNRATWRSGLDLELECFHDLEMRKLRTVCDGSFHVAVNVSLLPSGASNDEVEASHRLERIKPLQPREASMLKQTVMRLLEPARDLAAPRVLFFKAE